MSPVIFNFDYWFSRQAGHPLNFFLTYTHIILILVNIYISTNMYIWEGAAQWSHSKLDRMENHLRNLVGGKTHLSTLQPFPHGQNTASLSLLYHYLHGKCSDELYSFIPLGFFTRTITLWNRLPCGCSLNTAIVTSLSWGSIIIYPHNPNLLPPILSFISHPSFIITILTATLSSCLAMYCMNLVYRKDKAKLSK